MKPITRFQKAHLVTRMDLCKVMGHTAQGLVRHVLVPGTSGKQYNVYITRDNSHKRVEVQCELYTGQGDLDCRGNKVSVCTHAMAGVLTAAKEVGREARVCPDLKTAKRLSNLYDHAVAVPVVSKQSGRCIWLVTFNNGA